MQQKTTQTGVLMVNLGTPSAPTAKAVRSYLGEFLWDKRVVGLPRFVWWPILNGIVLRTRPSKVAEAYASIWSDGGSPLMVNSVIQQEKLKQRLSTTLGYDVPVALAMTYAEPSIKDALAELDKACVNKLVVLPLFPQNSSSTTAAVFDGVARGLGRTYNVPEMHFINGYHNHPLYIHALKQSVLDAWQENGRGERLLMSFHGIPKRYEKKGDPYPTQCRETAKALAHALELNDDQWMMTFQSRFGFDPWVQPYTDATLKQWGKRGVGRIDVICPAFSSDCLETLEEIAVENNEIFTEAGGGGLNYIPCLNSRDDHVELMAALVQPHL